MLAIGLVISFAGTVGGAAWTAAEGPPLCVQPRDAASEPTPPPVTTLRTREAEVAIYAIDGELRYSVIERSGRVALHLGTERDFVVHFPRLAEHVEAAFAEETAWLDASREPRAPSRRE